MTIYPNSYISPETEVLEISLEFRVLQNSIDPAQEDEPFSF